MPKIGLVALAGIIGVGKTTLARSLARILPARLILEEYDKNPFLASEFAGDKDAALPCEIFFLLSRLRQLPQTALTDEKTVVCDYLFEKNRIFARCNLDSRQFAVYDEVEKYVAPLITPPAVVIYLHDTVENCLARIARRGRAYEKNITAEYLNRICAGYEQLLENWRTCPVLHLDCAANDLRQSDAVQAITDKLINIMTADNNSQLNFP